VEDVGPDDPVRREAEHHDQRQADERARADRRHPEDDAEHEPDPRRARLRTAGERNAVALARHAGQRAPQHRERDDEERGGDQAE
jgi:hypothetical protein